MKQQAAGLTIALIALGAVSGFAQASSADVNTSVLQDAGQAIAAGDLGRAEDELNSVLRIAPGDFRALNLLGIVRAQQRREPEAEKLFLKVIEEKPEYASAHVNLGLLYVQMSRPEDAVAQLQQALRLSPARSDAADALVGVWRGQAHGASDSGDLEKALALLLQARKLEPGNADVQFEFAMVALRMSLLRDALDGFQQALKLRANDAPARYGLGRTYIELARFDEARQQFERYLAMRPDDASAHYALGLAFVELEQEKDARKEFQKSIAIKPEQTESYCQIGRLDLNAKDFSAAESNFQKVLARDPRNSCALTGSGRVGFETKNYSRAIELLERAIASDSKIREAHYYLGLAYARTGKAEESKQELQIATRLEHEEVEKRQNILRVMGIESSSDPPARQ